MRCRRSFLRTTRPIMLTWMLTLGAGPIAAAADEAAASRIPRATPVSLAGVDLVPAGATALYPGGTAFAFIGTRPDQVTIVDDAGVTIRRLRLEARAGSALMLAWDGRDEAGTPFRGRATLAVARGVERTALELRPLRGTPRTRSSSGVSFTLRATTP